jgi:hypothetical protein
MLWKRERASRTLSKKIQEATSLCQNLICVASAGLSHQFYGTIKESMTGISNPISVPNAELEGTLSAVATKKTFREI